MNTELLDFASPLFAALVRDLLAEGRLVRFSAKGSSMSPFVRDGDLLTVEPAREQDLRIGDIVLYSASPDRVVAHRLQNRVPSSGCTRLLIRGDNQIETDLVAPNQVLGRVVTVERGPRACRPASWPNRMAALAATRCRRRWRILRAALGFKQVDHR